MHKNIKTKESKATNPHTNQMFRSSRGIYGRSHKLKSRMYGAIDLGTNNCRLLIARPKNQGFQVTTSYSRIVRLGEGLLENGFLSDSAMDRTIRALTACSNKLESFNVIKSRSIATEACRRAENRDEFVTRVKDEIGLELETITSNEEARLALRGCQSLLNSIQTYAMVFDIGGGSTEIIWARKELGKFVIIDVLSLPIGVITLSENLTDSGVNRDNYQKMVHEVSKRLPNFCDRNNIRKIINEKKVQMLGTSGTLTTLGAVHLNLKRYDRSLIDGLELTFFDLSCAITKLTQKSAGQRTKTPCIGSERAELIIPGCAILEAISKRWPVGKLRVADRGLREGMLLELMVEDGISVTGNPAANTVKE